MIFTSRLHNIAITFPCKSGEISFHIQLIYDIKKLFITSLSKPFKFDLLL